MCLKQFMSLYVMRIVRLRRIQVVLLFSFRNEVWYLPLCSRIKGQVGYRCTTPELHFIIVQ